jgi:hypothetical protein
LSPIHPDPHRTVGLTSSENSPSNAVSFFSRNKSPFELPPTKMRFRVASQSGIALFLPL